MSHFRISKTKVIIGNSMEIQDADKNRLHLLGFTAHHSAHYISYIFNHTDDGIKFVKFDDTDSVKVIPTPWIEIAKLDKIQNFRPTSFIYGKLDGQDELLNYLSVLASKVDDYKLEHPSNVGEILPQRSSQRLQKFGTADNTDLSQSLEPAKTKRLQEGGSVLNVLFQESESTKLKKRLKENVPSNRLKPLSEVTTLRIDER